MRLGEGNWVSFGRFKHNILQLFCSRPKGRTQSPNYRTCASLNFRLRSYCDFQYTCTTLPKIISPSTPVHFEACPCEDSYMLLILCRECQGSNSYIPYRKDWSLPRHSGAEAEGQGPMKIIKHAQALWRLKASVTYKSTDWPRRFRGLKARVP
jgi:hypothetical protein